MANTFIETTFKMTKGSSQGFSKPILVVFLCTLFLYHMYHIHEECCIKVSYFCILAFVSYFIYMLKKKKVYSMYFDLKKQKIFLWYFIMAYFLYHIHGTKTLLFTCRYQRFLDSQALSLINKSSEYLSHSWSQMLPTYLYHSWIS